MTGGGDGGLCGKNCVTDRAMFTFCEAACGTGGSDCGIYNLGMTGCLGGDIEVEATVSRGLPSVLVCTGSGTGRCLGSGLGVIRGIELRQGHGGGSATYRASAGKGARCGCGGFLSRFVGVAVTGSGDGGLGDENCVTDRAVLTFGKTGCGASGSNRRIYDLGMALCLGSDVETEATVGGGLPSVLIGTGCGTGRSLGSGLGVIRCSQLGQSHGGSSATLGASAGKGARCGCGGFLGRFVGVAVGFRFAIAAGAGVLVFGCIYGGICPCMSCGRIGRGNGGVGCDVGQCLIPSLESIVIVSVTFLRRCRTGIGDASALGCGGSLQNRSIFIAESYFIQGIRQIRSFSYKDIVDDHRSTATARCFHIPETESQRFDQIHGCKATVHRKGNNLIVGRASVNNCGNVFVGLIGRIGHSIEAYDDSGTGTYSTTAGKLKAKLNVLRTGRIIIQGVVLAVGLSTPRVFSVGVGGLNIGAVVSGRVGIGDDLDGHRPRRIVYGHIGCAPIGTCCPIRRSRSVKIVTAIDRQGISCLIRYGVFKIKEQILGCILHTADTFSATIAVSGGRGVSATGTGDLVGGSCIGIFIAVA